MQPLLENFSPIGTSHNEHAVRRGSRIRVGLRDAPIYVDRAVARYLGCAQEDGTFDRRALMRRIDRLIVSFFQERRYCDRGATRQPELCGLGNARYFVAGTPGRYDSEHGPVHLGARAVVVCSLGDGWNVSLARRQPLQRVLPA